MVRYKLIGIGETDEHGVARMTKNAQGEPISGYVGVGSGEVDVVASLDNPINDSSIVSKISRIFDCPVYDGDNTPTSISWSKTNNAVVTDEVVSLIASVLNTNNNPCINIPVVFKQGNTVLGTAYTDCNGDATMTYTWADSDIFNVTAQVGQSLSEDITMFVKDSEYAGWTLLWYDLATSKNHKNSWDYNSKLNVSYSENGTTISKLEDNTTWRYWFYNDTAISTTKIGNKNSITSPSIIEFDVTEITGSIVTDVMDGNSHHLDNYQMTTIGHYKIMLDGSKVTVYKDGTLVKSLDMRGNVRFGFVFNAKNESITYKNLIIYHL